MELTPEKIIEQCALYFHVPIVDVISTCRDIKMVEARHTAMYFIRELITVDRPRARIKITLREVMGYFDHAAKNHVTVYAAIKEVNNRILTDKKYREDFNKIDAIFEIIKPHRKIIPENEPGAPFMANDCFTNEEMDRFVLPNTVRFPEQPELPKVGTFNKPHQFVEHYPKVASYEDSYRVIMQGHSNH